MKPIKLSMTAFGPYREKEVIDFRDLKNNRIFVISGATGAGKTTIFDGICYALYGSVSGEERDNAGNIRSDFADDQLHTAIELIFDMKGQQYRILRQLAHVKKGNKTATGEKNEFVEITASGEEVPVLDSHRVRDMNARLENIIGLTQDQFKQIVMLPQGEFRKLLTSDSQNKGEILRKIFKTEHYKQMAEKLNDKKKAAETELRDLQNEKNIHISRIQEAFPQRESALFEVLARENKSTTQIVEAFDVELQHYDEWIAQLSEQHKVMLNDIDASRKELYEGQQFNKELQLYRVAETRQLQLQQQEATINNEKIRLANAEKAEHIISYEANYRLQVKQYKEFEAQMQSMEEALVHAKATFINTQTALQQIQAKQEEQISRQQQLTDWQRILPFYEEVSKLEVSLLQVEKALAEHTHLLKQSENTIQQQRQKVVANEEVKQYLQQEISDYDELLQQITVLEKIQQHVLAKNSQQQIMTTTAEALASIQQQLKESTAAFTTVESNWLANQAYVLATQLVAGNPCPVCGSKIHEQQHFNETALVTREQVDVAKQSMNELERQKYELDAKKNQAQFEMERQVTALADYPSASYDEQSNSETISNLKRQIQSKQQQKQQLKELESAQLALHAAIESERGKLQQIQQRVNDCLLESKSQQAVLLEKRQQLPTAFSNQADLRLAMAKINEEILHFEAALKQITEQFDFARHDLTTKETSLLNKQEQVTRQKSSVQQVEDDFKHKVFEAGFKDGKDYTMARLQVEEMRQLKQLIDDYMKECYAVQQQLDSGKALYAKKEAIDVDAITVILNKKITVASDMNASISEKEHLLNTGKKMKAQLENAQKKMDELEVRAGQIIKLYELLSGKNELKISFERYLQIEYLEQIILAANERLIPLSNGQYRLLRSKRLDGNGKQSGLSLDVHDTYTGQERDVKTLSGGEQFNASLSLALGMSDIIQSFKGNVHMETMFIDEGFGTLDEEALAKAIDTLIDLQKTGRIIGIISHVAELKDTIPATLAVEKTKEGYSHTKFIIK